VARHEILTTRLPLGEIVPASKISGQLVFESNSCTVLQFLSRDDDGKVSRNQYGKVILKDEN
jgi:hypothetical protein